MHGEYQAHIVHVHSLDPALMNTVSPQANWYRSEEESDCASRCLVQPSRKTTSSTPHLAIQVSILIVLDSSQIYPLACRNLDHRREMRERAWSQPGWPETVVKTARLADLMDSFVMKPLSWSPLK